MCTLLLFFSFRRFVYRLSAIGLGVKTKLDRIPL